LNFRTQINNYHCKLSASINLSALYEKEVRRIKLKMIKTVNFMSTNFEQQKHTESSYINTLIQHNRVVEQKMAQLSQENKNLRRMLMINQNQNSFKSFEQLIKDFEMEEQKDKQDTSKKLSPSREQEMREKLKSNSMIKETLKDRRKRGGRKRTEEFYFGSMGESSPDETTKEDVSKGRRRSTMSAFQGYSMKLQENLQENAKPPQDKDTPKSESMSSSSKSDSDKDDKEDKEEKKEETKNNLSKVPLNKVKPKRKRMNSEGNANDFAGLSPPNHSKNKRTIMSKETKESPLGLMKGGGYKMSMQAPAEEETKLRKDSDADSDYFGCFNKSKIPAQKREKRFKSMMNNDDDDSSKEMAKETLKILPKIKYSIHSIAEEENQKSKSSSSTSSYKSSDDFTILFCTRTKKAKMSSISNKWSSPTQVDQSSSSGSSKRLRSFKTKKYTEGPVNPFYDLPGKVKSVKRRRMSSISLILKKLETD